MKFRKLPVVIEAEQWTPEKEVDGVVVTRGEAGVDYGSGVLGSIARIRTLEGMMKVSLGDWVITGVKGEKYPCKPDIFSMTYEPA